MVSNLARAVQDWSGFLPGNAYMLEELDGVKFPVAVNGQHLKKYFPSMWEGE